MKIIEAVNYTRDGLNKLVEEYASVISPAVLHRVLALDKLGAYSTAILIITLDLREKGLIS